MNIVHTAIETRGPWISKALGVDKSMILWKLEDSYNDNLAVENERVQILSSRPNKVTTPNTLLRALYPSKSTNINALPIQNRPYRSQVFNNYCKLGIPSIEPQHINQIMKILINPYNLKRPSRIVNYDSTVSKKTAMGYLNQQKKRSHSIDMIKRIVDDFKAHGLPISNHEQNLILYHIFYKDSPDILEVCKQSLQLMDMDYTESEFTWEFYKNLQLNDINSLNNIIDIAIMHRNRKIFDDVKQRIQSPNRDTFKGVLKGFKHFNDQIAFNVTLKTIDFPLDISVINEIISGLVRFDQIDDAWGYVRMFEAIEESDTYDNHLYLHYYDTLRKIIDLEDISIIPNEQTFKPLLNHYTESSELLRVVEVMEHFKVPLSTNTFLKLFQSNLDGNQLKLSMKKLLESFEQNYITDQDFAHGSGNGNKVKLSDSLMRSIQSHYKGEWDGLFDYITELRRSSTHDFGIINEINHAKYNFLCELYQD
ncbi:hypothetical protein CLIB1444_02S10330 [[Candida] jaroonii]|uniref:Uncharacterized protein n=1 Tax=[Candida] jaroonii TaxID=467808 RepID=A0ACA9Y3Y2_9ASCO|nr:hypothetical protein CLIB1444_02S10330 [[Candida] jaroonii]